MFTCLLAGECAFQYELQPPSTTINDCNPYGENNRISISIECRVSTKVTYMYEIRWFQEKIDKQVVKLGHGHPETLQENAKTSRYHDMNFLYEQYNSSFLGKYWCQVINTTADPDQPLMRSNVFTLLPPHNYCATTCTGVQYTRETTCADIPDIAQSNTTSTIIAISSCLTTQHFISG